MRSWRSSASPDAGAPSGDPADPGPLGGDAVLQGGVLQVRGDSGPDDIVVLLLFLIGLLKKA